MRERSRTARSKGSPVALSAKFDDFSFRFPDFLSQLRKLDPMRNHLQDMREWLPPDWSKWPYHLTNMTRSWALPRQRVRLLC